MDRTLSSASLVDYLNYGLVPAPRTIYRNVRKLQAAESLTIRLDAPEIIEPKTYWTVRYDPVSGKSNAEWFEEFHAELQHAIGLRMVSDVPPGTFLWRPRHLCWTISCLN